MPTLKGIINGGHSIDSKYVSTFADLSVLVKQLKDGGFSIALTQGVYDMFHVGHARYLADARSYGDILIVGVDSDELTRQMKGEGRPLDDFAQRIELLAMLSVVNIIVKRDVDQDKYDLIKLVSPDVLIMSQTTKSFGDDDLVQLKQFCGEIKHLEAKAATTTTAKMRRLADTHGLETAESIVRAMNLVLTPLGATIQVVRNGGKKSE